MRALPLIVIYIAAAISPLVLSALVGGPPRAIRDEIASGAGMLAFSMILAEFVLSGRFKTVSGGIGLDITMRFHQLMARGALALAMIHPFLYKTLSNPAQPGDPTRQLSVTSDFSDLVTGILAFLLLPSFVLISIGRKQLDYSYETWRLMHGIGALLIALLLLHHTTHAGRYGVEPELVWFWYAMTGLAVFSLFVVYVVKPLRQSAGAWDVVDIRPISTRTWGVTVKPKGRELQYKAGQFVWLNIDHSPFSVFENPFSISSAPASGNEVSFVIKELGDFTNNLGRYANGTKAYLDGPYGTLTVDGRTEPGIALIAGGVGIAPMLGIMRELELTGDDRARTLLYGNRAADQIVFPDELEKLAENPLTQVVHVLSEPPDGWSGPTGFIDYDLLKAQFSPEQLRSWVFVLCGPPIMMDIVEDSLISLGTPADRILSERFEYD